MIDEHMWVEPVVLSGELVRLEPLAAEHIPALSAVGLHEDLWRWTVSAVRTAAEMEAYVTTALRGRDTGQVQPFVTVAQATGEVVGSTRYGNIDPEHRRLEIGWTWLTPGWQRSGANIEAKLLMLEHAFERLRCIRVEFKTDALNEKSRRALLGIGAKEEGTLRQHMVVWDGRLRDTVYYSVIDSEWPEVKMRLRQKLESAKARQ